MELLPLPLLLVVAFLLDRVQSTYYCIPAPSNIRTCAAGQQYFASIHCCCSQTSLGNKDEQKLKQIPGQTNSLTSDTKDAPLLRPFDPNPFNPLGGLSPNSNLAAVDRLCMGMFCSDRILVDAAHPVPCPLGRTLSPACNNQCCGPTPLLVPAEIFAGGAGPATALSNNCQDRSLPGKPSDCPNNKQLCDKPLYRDLMTVQCPRTCGRCGLSGSLSRALQNDNILGIGGSGTPGCIDNVGLNGRSECRQQRAKCTLRLYAHFMAEECCITCRAFNPPIPLLGLLAGGGGATPLIRPPGLRVPTELLTSGNAQTRQPGFDGLPPILNKAEKSLA